jgi:hypothetical protein
MRGLHLLITATPEDLALAEKEGLRHSTSTAHYEEWEPLVNLPHYVKHPTLPSYLQGTDIRGAPLMELLQGVGENWDATEQRCEVVGALFHVVTELYTRGECPPEWQYSPGTCSGDPREFLGDEALYAGATTTALLTFGRALFRFDEHHDPDDLGYFENDPDCSIKAIMALSEDQ